ncbi:MAG: CHRD domain-containing protein [Phenylobacterium sp.]|uniref:CHRD domain-containing protein n=1 Tax=Phenylobacterium sp. TaxID=1871053 RepID=UPI001226070F|nr:CHRD domain-containing protein [Phenylobacterium sp.]TAJ74365.1 MAG: CHRD domain-containing protein [Phenylobacterium sp.]
MKRALATIALLAAALAGTAHAATFNFYGTMSGENEAPANASAATGDFTAILDDVANSFFVDLSYSGLSTNASIGILHCCAPAGANAVSILNFTGFPSATSGTYSSTLFGLTEADITGIKSGLSYINIHTVALPQGEIRGQLISSAGAAIPEPVTWVMIVVGFGVLGSSLRRKQRQKLRFNFG